MTRVVDTVPQLASTLLSFAGPQGAFASALLGEVFNLLQLADSGPSTEDIVLMGVERLETFIRSQFDDAAVRDAAAHIATTYSWFQIAFDRAKVDKGAVNRDSTVLRQIGDALGPNSFLDLGIAKLSDERYRYLGVNTLCMAIGLKLTLWKIQMLVNGDTSSVPRIIDQIAAYIQTIDSANRDAEAYAFRQLNGTPPDQFIKRRDEMVELLYQGDATVPSRAKLALSRAQGRYLTWRPA
jgi:hypothetical protein